MNSSSRGPNIRGVRCGGVGARLIIPLDGGSTNSGLIGDVMSGDYRPRTTDIVNPGPPGGLATRSGR